VEDPLKNPRIIDFAHAASTGMTDSKSRRLLGYSEWEGALATARHHQDA
jgi:hypothetical protein